MGELFGADRVFMDVEDIAPGQNFAQALDRTMAACDAVLVVIGPRWMEIFRQRAQEGQQDYVRHEIEAALVRKIAVVPVLVGGASMGQLTGLPDALAGLALLQAAELRDSTFAEDCARLARALPVKPGFEDRRNQQRVALKKRWVIAGATAIVVIVAALLAAGPWREYRARQAAARQMTATARVQIEQGQYESAFKTYRDFLKSDPANRAALEGEIDAAMLWLQNFHVIVAAGGSPEDIAGPPLAAILNVLETGLARANGRDPRAADILAHIGWAHWLNRRLAYKEFGDAAQRTLRQALTADPSNVFANAMLGNILLQTGGDSNEALRHFDAAARTGRARALVRSMQLGGMVYNDAPGIRPALIRVADEMRRNGETIEETYKRRIRTAYNPGMNNAGELKETLSAVPPDQAWATFLWLDAAAGEPGDADRMRHRFIRASLLEIEGKNADALAMFQDLASELRKRGYAGRLAEHVDAAVRRLSR
jgi:tetratricopeptide (TPR) repeat protein